MHFDGQLFLFARIRVNWVHFEEQPILIVSSGEFFSDDIEALDFGYVSLLRVRDVYLGECLSTPDLGSRNPGPTTAPKEEGEKFF